MRRGRRKPVRNRRRSRCLCVESLEQRLLLSANAGDAPDFGYAFRLGSAVGESGVAVAADATGNAYVLGTFGGTIDFDPGPGVVNSSGNAFVAKYTPVGALVWVRSISGDIKHDGADIAVDATGNVYVTGGFAGTIAFDPAGTANLSSGVNQAAFALKLDANGNFAWARSFGGGQTGGLGITVDNAGNVYTTGFFAGTTDFDPGAGSAPLTSAGSFDAYVSKLNSAGNYVWAKRMGGAYSTSNAYDVGDSGYDIAVDGSGNVYTTGTFRGIIDFDPSSGSDYFLTSSGGGGGEYFNDAFVWKLDTNGGFGWAKRLGGSADGRSIAVDAQNNVYTAGNVYGHTADLDPGPGVYNIKSPGDKTVYVSKLSPLGDFVWASGIASSPVGPGYNPQLSLGLDSSGSAFVAGQLRGTLDMEPAVGSTFNLTSAGGSDMFIARLDTQAGGLRWATAMGGPSDDQALGMAVTSAGDVFTTGYFQGTVDFDPTAAASNVTSAGSQDVFVSHLIYDSGSPRVTINRGGSQADPTAQGSIEFTAVFSEPVTGFATGDVSLTGSTAPGTLSATITPIGVDGTTYSVVVTGMTGSGTVVATIPQGVAIDVDGHGNRASASTDNTVLYDIAAPSATLANPVNGASVSYVTINGRQYIDIAFADLGGSGINVATITDSDAEFALVGTAASGVTVQGAGALVAGTTATYRYQFTGAFGIGSVTVSFLAGSFFDMTGNANLAGSATFEAADLPALVVSVNDISKIEGNSLTSNAAFTVTLSIPSTKTITVAYTTAAAATGDKAVAGKDFTSVTGTLTFSPGVTTRTIVVPVVGDLIDEPDEAFLVKLYNPVNVALGDDTGVCTIVDNDAAPTLSINNAVAVTETNPGATVTAVFTVSLSAASGKTVTVDFGSADYGSCFAGADYTGTGGTLQFAPGVRSQVVRVTVLGDLLDEATETFRVNLANAVNATILRASGTGTITDNDPVPTLAINDISVDETAGSAAFTVTLSAVSGLPVTVSYSTANSAATAGADYTGIPTTPVSRLVIPAGQRTGTIVVPVLDDIVDEPDETFFVKLATPINATILDGSGTARIFDGDQDPARIIDDGQTGFTTRGTWTVVTPTGYLKDYRYNGRGTGAETATWTFNVTPGVYRVSATWVPSTTGRATNAPFTISDGSTALGTVLANQQLAPGDLIEAGTRWKHLGDQYYVYGTTLNVNLTDLANNTVVADAVRVERIGDFSKLLGDASALANSNIFDLPVPQFDDADITLDDGTGGSGLPMSRTRLLLSPSATATVGAINGLLTQLNAKIIGTIPPLQTLVIAIPDPGDLSGVKNAMTTLIASPSVAIAVQDTLLGTTRISAPSNLGDNWAWNSPTSGNLSLGAVRAPQAWNLLDFLRGKGQQSKIGILDVGFVDADASGFDDHPDLAGLQTWRFNTVANRWELGTGPVPHDPKTGAPIYHGQHVAGIIGALYDNRDASGVSAGVDGINPLANNTLIAVSANNGPVGGGSNFFQWQRESLASVVTVLTKMLDKWPDFDAVNISLGYNWYLSGSADSSPGLINPSTNPYAQNIVARQGEWVRRIAANHPNTILVAAAGNDSEPYPEEIDAKWASPFNYAALGAGSTSRNVIVVEAVDQLYFSGGRSYVKADYSNVNGTVAAPGTRIVSTWDAASYKYDTGTSMAAPLVTGLIGLLQTAAKTVTPANKLSVDEIRTLIAGDAYTGVMSTAELLPIGISNVTPLIDSFAALMGIDVERGGFPYLQRALVDVDDGTLDGNSRVDQDDSNGNGLTSDEIAGSLNTGGRRGDNVIDMKDFRAYRDALLQILRDANSATVPRGPNEAATNFSSIIALDGLADHPKKDLNNDGRVVATGSTHSGPSESVYPRFDFNGSGTMELAGRFVAAGQGMAPFKIDPDSAGNMRDFDVLTDPNIWNDVSKTADGNYIYDDVKNDSDGDGVFDYIYSADLHFRLDKDLTPTDGFQIKIASLKNGLPLWEKTITTADWQKTSTTGGEVLKRVITVPLFDHRDVRITLVPAEGDPVEQIIPAVKYGQDLMVKLVAPKFNPADLRRNEGSTGGYTAFPLGVTLPSAIPAPVSVQYTTVDGTANAPSDYTAVTSRSLGFLANAVAPTTALTVQVAADTKGEANETFRVSLGGYALKTTGVDPVVYMVVPASATVTIVNDEAVFGRYRGTASFVEEYDSLWMDPETYGAQARGEYTITVDVTLFKVSGFYDLQGPGTADVTVYKTPTAGWGAPESRHIIIDEPVSYSRTAANTGMPYGNIELRFINDDNPSDQYYYRVPITVTGAFNQARTATGNGYIQVGGQQHPFVFTKVAALMADGPPVHPDQQVTEITADDVARLAAAASRQWTIGGAVGAAAPALKSVRFEIADLSDNLLAQAAPGVIYIDRDAAGYGWYVDPTPRRNEEYTRISLAGFRALGSSPAAGRMDLLTVLTHEMGHVLGLDDLDAKGHPDDVMAETLSPGTRRTLPRYAAIAFGGKTR